MQTDSLYTGMAGMQAITAQMEAVASNLSNAQTPGYESVQAETEAQLYQGENAPVGADAMVLTPNPSLTPGPLRNTGDPLNVAVGGGGWLEVQTSGGTALTRDGSMSISSAGLLTDSAGDPILSSNGTPISLPQLANLQIGSDGTISGVLASDPSGPTQNFGQLALTDTPSGTLTPLGNSLYAPPSGASLSQSSSASVQQGYLNDSNVDVTQAMMEMIDSSRSYELQSQMIKSQSAASQDLNALLGQG